MYISQSSAHVVKIIQSNKCGWEKKQYIVRRSEVKAWKMSDKWYVIFYKYMSKIVYGNSWLVIYPILYWNTNCLASYIAKISDNYT